MERSSAWLAPVLQAGTVAVGLAALLLAPTRGDMLLVPLSPAAAVQVLPLALAGGGRLVARGPLPGSLVIRGDRHLAGAMIARGIVPLAARAAGCGGGTV